MESKRKISENEIAKDGEIKLSEQILTDYIVENPNLSLDGLVKWAKNNCNTFLLRTE